jgi:prepilin-type N-terminal cleavage/methylation domain-containing protein
MKLNNKVGILKSNRAFTLIEVLIVVAILGTLAAVAFPAVGPLIKLSMLENAKSERRTVQVAVDKLMTRNSLDFATQDGREDGPALSTEYLFSQGYLFADTIYCYDVLTATGEVKLLFDENNWPLRRIP